MSIPGVSNYRTCTSYLLFGGLELWRDGRGGARKIMLVLSGAVLELATCVMAFLVVRRQSLFAGVLCGGLSLSCCMVSRLILRYTKACRYSVGHTKWDGTAKHIYRIMQFPTAELKMQHFDRFYQYYFKEKINFVYQVSLEELGYAEPYMKDIFENDFKRLDDELFVEQKMLIEKIIKAFYVDSVLQIKYREDDQESARKADDFMDAHGKKRTAECLKGILKEIVDKKDATDSDSGSDDD